VQPFVLDLHGLPHWLPVAESSVRAALRWGAYRTGLPVIVVAAISLTASWYLFKRTVRFAVGIVISLALLLVATNLGWIAW